MGGTVASRWTSDKGWSKAESTDSLSTTRTSAAAVALDGNGALNLEVWPRT